MNQPEQLLQDKAVAAMLGLCRASVWKLAAQGRLTPVKLSSRCTRFRLSEILELIGAPR